MVEGARLESVYRGNSIMGSNPILSAKYLIIFIIIIFFTITFYHVDLIKIFTVYNTVQGERGTTRSITES